MSKKILVIHEWWADYGGSEKVALAINEALPGSDFIVLRNLTPNVIKAQSTWNQRLPFFENKTLLAGASIFTYRTLTMRHYDLVISSSHTFAHTAKLINDRKTKYFSYVHTPARSLWHPETDSRGLSLGQNSHFRRALQKLDTRLGNHVHSIAANGTEVQNRIKKDWGRDSIIINPPISDHYLIKQIFPNLNLPEKFILTAGRLVAYKRHDFAIQLASHLGMPIVIAGGGPEESNLRALSASLNVDSTFVINPDDSEWGYLLARAECLIFPSHEDFGMTPIEAMKQGTPVLALGTGGALDYVTDGLNGYKIPNLFLDDWALAYRQLRTTPESVKNSVLKYSYSRFNEQVQNWILGSQN
jgi:glycosyltransferase involved in cell wall biosynthesis